MKKNKTSPKPCRIASLKGFDNVLLGRDMAGIFKPGHVYNIREIDGVILVDDLGEHATEPHLEGNRINAYAVSGSHCLTKGEYKRQSDNENN